MLGKGQDTDSADDGEAQFDARNRTQKWPTRGDPAEWPLFCRYDAAETDFGSAQLCEHGLCYSLRVKRGGAGGLPKFLQPTKTSGDPLEKAVHHPVAGLAY